jgi:chromosome segregation ATPase
MPKNKDEHVEVNGDGGRTGIDNSRGTRPSGSSNNSGIGNANGSGNDYGHKHSKSNSIGNRHDGENTESQLYLSLGPHTQATSEVIQHMSETYQAFRTLSDSYKKHMRDIQEIPKIQERCIELEKQCEDMKEHIKRQKITIDTLKEMSREREDDVKQYIADIKKEREGLEAEKKKFDRQKENVEKRIKVQEAEEKKRQDKELEKLKTEQDNQYENLKEMLEQGVKKREDEIKKRLTDLEADNGTLTKELNVQKGQVEEQRVWLANAKDEYDVLRRAKNSFKEEKEKLETQLKKIENEFALNDGQTTEF